ncbi:MAG: hypothetical protein ACE5O2_14565 [Armatimonadota bacterium]
MTHASERKKKAYEKPAVVYTKRLESMASICGSALLDPGSGTCRTDPGTCLVLYNP